MASTVLDRMWSSHCSDSEMIYQTGRLCRIVYFLFFTQVKSLGCVQLLTSRKAIRKISNLNANKHIGI
jgi:hypothetical protein